MCRETVEGAYEGGNADIEGWRARGFGILKTIRVGIISSQRCVLEAIHRANLQSDSRGVITAKDIQRILPELFLDF